MRAFGGSQRIRLGLAAGGAVAAWAVVTALRVNVVALTIVWSALMVASFVGWGSLVNLWLARGRWMDWGMRAGWGMGFVLATGGYLALAHLAVGPVLIGQIVVGIGLLLCTWRVKRPSLLSSRRVVIVVSRAGVWILVAGAYAITAFLFCVYLSKHDFQPSDDPPLYFALPKKIIDTGSLFEPFNARRVSTLGGQPYLHALFAAIAPFYYLHVVDGGIGLVLTFGLLVGHVGRTGFKDWHAAPLGLALLLLFTLIPVRVNTASEVTGIPVILTIYRTLRLPLDETIERPPWPMGSRRVVVLAVLTVVSMLLRTSNGPAVVPFVLLVFGSDFILSTRRPWALAELTSFVNVLALFSAAFAMTLLPWSLMLHQSCGTFFYPLQQGNITPGWTFLRTAPLKKAMAAWVSVLSYDKPISVFVPFVIAGLVPLRGRSRNDLVFLTFGCLLGLWALARGADAFDAYAHARYSHAYLAGAALAIAISVDRFGPRAAMVALAIAMHITSVHDEVRSGYLAAIEYVSRDFDVGRKEEAAFAAGTAAYADIQSHLEPTATMVTAVHEPWRFSFKRNRIFTLDLLGGTGPKPGWPAFRGAQALLDYFRANGVRYVVFTNFDTANEFYNRSHWQLFLKGEDYLGGEAPFQLDAMNAIDKLATMRHVVYRANAMTVLDLDTSP